MRVTFRIHYLDRVLSPATLNRHAQVGARGFRVHLNPWRKPRAPTDGSLSLRSLNRRFPLIIQITLITHMKNVGSKAIHRLLQLCVLASLRARRIYPQMTQITQMKNVGSKAIHRLLQLCVLACTKNLSTDDTDYTDEEYS